ncbi:hypothetical protein [Bradyrhizobium sp. ERR14]|uniref:hypothetical protein n=1 Tax=Bradyrhizobium sp. ERR14 TaxID=2663837 RepID=UPI001FEE7453|nr:hypothetical protein [Bradyrhizobium sp. ERR14]
MEQLPAPVILGRRLPESMLHLYDVVVSFDHCRKKCWSFLADGRNRIRREGASLHGVAPTSSSRRLPVRP